MQTAIDHDKLKQDANAERLLRLAGVKAAKNPFDGAGDRLAQYERERVSESDKAAADEFAQAIRIMQAAFAARSEAKAKLDAIHAEMSALLSVPETKLAWETCFKQFVWNDKFKPNPVSTGRDGLPTVAAPASIPPHIVRVIGTGDTGRERWKVICKLRELYWQKYDAEAEVRRKGQPISHIRLRYPALKDLTEAEVMAVKL